MAEQNGEGVHKAGEYEALMQGMAMVQKMGGKAVEMFSDSKLVVEIGRASCRERV